MSSEQLASMREKSGSQQVDSQEGESSPKPGEPGLLVADMFTSSSSTFELLASEEMTSQVLGEDTNKETVQEVSTPENFEELLEDLFPTNTITATSIYSTFELLASEEVTSQVIFEENVRQFGEYAIEDDMPIHPINVLTATTSYSSPLSTMLDQILLDMKIKGKSD